MSRYVISYEAREDLKNICRYLAEQSQSAAARLRDIFFERFLLLARHPMMGEAREDLAPDLRAFTAGNYVILYKPTPQGITVVQVVHSARDLSALFRKGRD